MVVEQSLDFSRMLLQNAIFTVGCKARAKSAVGTVCIYLGSDETQDVKMATRCFQKTFTRNWWLYDKVVFSPIENNMFTTLGSHVGAPLCRR